MGYLGTQGGRQKLLSKHSVGTQANMAREKTMDEIRGRARRFSGNVRDAASSGGTGKTGYHNDTTTSEKIRGAGKSRFSSAGKKAASMGGQQPGGQTKQWGRSQTMDEIKNRAGRRRFSSFGTKAASLGKKAASLVKLGTGAAGAALAPIVSLGAAQAGKASAGGGLLTGREVADSLLLNAGDDSISRLMNTPEGVFSLGPDVGDEGDLRSKLATAGSAHIKNFPADRDSYRNNTQVALPAAKAPGAVTDAYKAPAGMTVMNQPSDVTPEEAQYIAAVNAGQTPDGPLPGRISGVLTSGPGRQEPQTRLNPLAGKANMRSVSFRRPGGAVAPAPRPVEQRIDPRRKLANAIATAADDVAHGRGTPSHGRALLLKQAGNFAGGGNNIDGAMQRLKRRGQELENQKTFAEMMRGDPKRFKTEVVESGIDGQGMSIITIDQQTGEGYIRMADGSVQMFTGRKERGRDVVMTDEDTGEQSFRGLSISEEEAKLRMGG